MGRLAAPVPKKRPLDTASVTESSNTSTDSVRKRKSKDKKQDQSTENAATAAGSAFEKRHSTIGRAASDPRDEPAVQKTNVPPGRRLPSPVINFDGLSRPSNGTRSRIDEGPEQAEGRLEKMRGAVRTLLECMGEDPDREGLMATPSRYAKALLFLTRGYQVNVHNIVNNALFHEGHNEMVIVKGIDICSLCEHHLVPFTGKVYLIQVHISSNPKLTEIPDAYWLHPLRYRHRALQAPAHRRDVLPAAANSGAPHQGGCPRHYGDP